MSEFKGTKGKWVVLHNRVATLEGEITICKIEQYNEEDEADALLISKAPEMLKELNNIVDCWDKDVFQELDIDSIRKLIKQATEI